MAKNTIQLNATLIIPYANLCIISNKYDLKTQTADIKEVQVEIEDLMDQLWQETVDFGKKDIIIAIE